MMSALEVNSFMEREIDLYEWILQVREYVKEKEASLISHRRLVFIIESQTFKTATDPSRDLTVMVSVINQGKKSLLVQICMTHVRHGLKIV